MRLMNEAYVNHLRRRSEKRSYDISLPPKRWGSFVIVVLSDIPFSPDVLSLQERRLIVDITLYPDDPNA